MVFTKQSKKLTTGLCQIYNLHDCKKEMRSRYYSFYNLFWSAAHLQPVCCSFYSHWLHAIKDCRKYSKSGQRGQNNAINDRVNYNQNICSAHEGTIFMLFSWNFWWQIQNSYAILLTKLSYCQVIQPKEPNYSIFVIYPCTALILRAYFCLVFFSNFKRMVGQIQRFLALNHLHPKGNHQNFSSSVSTVSEELRNKQTHKLTDTLQLYKKDYH